MLCLIPCMIFIGLGSWYTRNRRSVWISGATATGAAIAIAVVGGGDTPHDSQIWKAPSIEVLSIKADTDFPALPSRTDWCDGADHCWLFGGSGTISDSGSGSWTLTASGSPRTGIETGLPVYSSGAVSWTGETAAGLDTSSDYYSTTGDYSTSAVSVTAVYSVAGDSAVLADVGYTTGTGVRVGVAGGALEMVAEGGSGTMTMVSTDTSYATHGLHCVTWVADGASSTIYADGAELAHSGETAHGTISGTGETITIGGGSEDAIQARIHVDYAAAGLADHQALCGSWGAAIRRDHAAYADTSWTHTGGARCFSTSATTATCIPGGLPAYAYSATLAGRGWAVEPGRINRVFTDVDCAGSWTCNGTATTTGGKIAPDGSATAWEISVGTGAVTNDIEESVGGYTGDAALYPRMWIKCASGSVVLQNRAGAVKGLWTVDCASIAGSWTLIGPEDIGGIVVQTNSWLAGGSGLSGMYFYAASGTVTASIWMPTLTETDGLSVIPVASASVDTGSPVFAAANDGSYWATGDTVTTVIDEITGTCVVPGNPSFLLSGSSTCTGVLNSVEVTR